MKHQVHTAIGLKNEMFAVAAIGEEFHDALTGKPHAIVNFQELDRDCGRGTPVTGWKGLLQRVPASLLELHHDPVARTYSGFCFMLQAFNPDVQVNPETTISIVLFEMKAASNLVIAQAMPRKKGP